MSDTVEKPIIDDGGPAMPVPYSSFEVWALHKPPIHGHPGMTLRDYAAIRILAAMVANEKVSEGFCHLNKQDPEATPAHMAKRAIVFADAFIAERNKTL